MIIRPAGEQMIRVEDVIAGLNRAPKPGDEGHTDDHGRLATAIFDVPQTAVGLGYAVKVPEQGWMWNRSIDPNGEPKPTTFAEVREFVERAGVVAVADDEHSAADGATDHTEDSEVLDGVSLFIFASGVVGLTYAVGDLIQQVAALKAAQG